MNKQSYSQLSQDERDRIAVLKAKGQSISDIARVLRRNKGTISRELKRNKSPVYNVYLPHKAQERSETRKREAAKRERLKHTTIRRYVKRKIKAGWSPEQIAGRIGQKYPYLSISHEAVYQYVYDPRVRKQEDLVSYLVRHHRKRFPKGHSRKHHNPHIPERISIMKRPKYILKRKQLGHWEADTVISRKSLESLEEQITKLEQKQNDWVEPMENWLNYAQTLGKVASDGNLFAKKVTAKEIFGSNLFLSHGSVRLAAPSGFDSPSQNQWAALRTAHEMVSKKPKSMVLVYLLYQVRTYFQNR